MVDCQKVSLKSKEPLKLKQEYESENEEGYEEDEFEENHNNLTTDRKKDDLED